MQTQKKRCPKGHARNAVTSECDLLQPCFVHSEELMYQRLLEQIDHYPLSSINNETNTNPIDPISKKNTQKIKPLLSKAQESGAITNRLMPTTFMTRKPDQIRKGTFNKVYPVNTRKKCADKTNWPVHVVRVAIKPAENEENLEDMKLEARLSVNMSMSKIGPKIFDIIYQPDGRFVMVMEKYDWNLDMLLRRNAMKTEDTAKRIHSILTDLLRRLADQGMFCTDVKPENTVGKIVRSAQHKKNKLPDSSPLSPEDTLELRFIDFDVRCNTPFTAKHRRQMKECMASEKLDSKDFAFYLMYALFMRHLHIFHIPYFIEPHLTIAPCVAQVLPLLMATVDDYMLMVNHYGLRAPNTPARASKHRICADIVNAVFRVL